MIIETAEWRNICMLKENIQIVEDNIRKACERSGRDPKDVLLLPVSKTKAGKHD